MEVISLALGAILIMVVLIGIKVDVFSKDEEPRFIIPGSPFGGGMPLGINPEELKKMYERSTGKPEDSKDAGLGGQYL